ncbi:TetR family transcriptional regulator [Streptomyces eurocidicus]|uniref:AcrR family transcriptional regulator n=1 Tax=Streptomyces eurocidicus TaxID=66423 RepID=A0A2N8P2J8_STREU|nr:TetR family transcriptional regulator [Streptomyces eurocidicus]MBB5117383.1 AcrR family transcriptional regulator [Streptomyces eurocidicus]MBF6053228.1 TetR family transcriptional regulator [Streptomyces eurocidicus]PNE35247.1 TetR family transcriptional regulator [Streptomyces eurocidicus]
MPEPLTPTRILEATEDVLRRFGPAKATVVDVARALGVSHGSVYRHFGSKAALREAVTQRWLDQSHTTLSAVADAEGPAGPRLREWLAALFAAKRRKAGDDPELFATYMVLVGENSGVVERHIETMIEQLARIVGSGVRDGEFRAADPAATARALWDATNRFHDPAYAAEWSRPGIDEAFEVVCDLVLRGLRA